MNLKDWIARNNNWHRLMGTPKEIELRKMVLMLCFRNGELPEKLIAEYDGILSELVQEKAAAQEKLQQEKQRVTKQWEKDARQWLSENIEVSANGPWLSAGSKYHCKNRPINTDKECKTEIDLYKPIISSLKQFAVTSFNPNEFKNEVQKWISVNRLGARTSCSKCGCSVGIQYRFRFD